MNLSPVGAELGLGAMVTNQVGLSQSPPPEVQMVAGGIRLFLLR